MRQRLGRFLSIVPFGILPNHVYLVSHQSTYCEVKSNTPQMCGFQAPNLQGFKPPHKTRPVDRQKLASTRDSARLDHANKAATGQIHCRCVLTCLCVHARPCSALRRGFTVRVSLEIAVAVRPPANTPCCIAQRHQKEGRGGGGSFFFVSHRCASTRAVTSVLGVVLCFTHTH